MNPLIKTLFFALVTFLGIFLRMGFDVHRKPYFKWVLTLWGFFVVVALILFSTVGQGA